jgi:hypothetical protein
MQDSCDPAVSPQRVTELLAKLRLVDTNPPRELPQTPAHEQTARELATVQGEVLSLRNKCELLLHSNALLRQDNSSLRTDNARLARVISATTVALAPIEVVQEAPRKRLEVLQESVGKGGGVPTGDDMQGGEGPVEEGTWGGGGGDEGHADGTSEDDGADGSSQDDGAKLQLTPIRRGKRCSADADAHGEGGVKLRKPDQAPLQYELEFSCGGVKMQPSAGGRGVKRGQVRWRH